MSVAIEKLEGVESVKVSLNEGVAEIVLVPGNELSLEAVREAVRRNGFTPKGAHVRVAGVVVERGGKPALEVTGPDVVYQLAPAARGAAQLPKDAVGKKVMAEGHIAGPLKGKDAEPLTLELGSIQIK